MLRLQYQNYPQTCLWTHLWTYLMLEIQCLFHNQFKPRPMVCRSCLFQDVYPVMPEILQIISIITVVCISEGVGQAPPLFPLHHRQNMEYLKSTMETPVFDILIRWKLLDPNHKQVLWL